MYHKIGSVAYKEGLENIEALLDIVEHPDNKIKTIHVAGTNGKGSVANLLSSYFQELGYKTGLFTSPHLIDFKERIKINGIDISEEEVLDFFRCYKAQFDLLEPSFFEMTTALAFYYFAKEKVDIAIIEVGLGGRLDCTNVIVPELSVITNISLEHTQMLGDTLAKIATEKAGIIKPGVPVVIGEYQEETFPVFQQIAASRESSLWLADQEIQIIKEKDLQHISVLNRGKVLYQNIKLPLLGDYQLKNIATFVKAIQVLQNRLAIKQEVIIPAIENLINNTHFLGRWHMIQHSPLIICDVGHNLAGLELTMQQLASMPYKKLHFIIGFVNDKDVDQMVNVLPQEATFYVCRAQIERALEPTFLAEKMKNAGLKVMVETTVVSAYQHALSLAGKDDILFIGGSCFVVGDFLTYFQSN
ncbi:MAG: folylpolyglutamate synthase/dihydrofolate synthase family protein [Bacteroidales bacterium]